MVPVTGECVAICSIQLRKNECCRPRVVSEYSMFASHPTMSITSTGSRVASYGQKSLCLDYAGAHADLCISGPTYQGYIYARYDTNLVDNGKLTTRLYDKRDDFNFPIVNFPFLSSNIPSAPAYGVYVSQLIRYARTCSNYQDFMERGKVLTQKLLSQGYQKTKLVATLKKFYGRHHDLVNPYNVAVSRIVSDVFASDAP